MREPPPLPPGQVEIDDFPRFGLPHFAFRFPTETERIEVAVDGDVERPTRFAAELGSLERVEQLSDLHCVTTWTRRGLRWSGWRFRDFCELLVVLRVRPEADANRRGGLPFMSRITHSLVLALAIFVAGSLVFACKSTRVAEVWVARGEPPHPYRRLMIVGLAPNPGGRAQYENDFVDRLANVHVLAIASVNLIPDVKDIDRTTVESWLAEYRLDGVLVTRVTDVKRESEYVPPTTTLGGWYGAWRAPVSPGYVVENTTIALETDLFDARTEKLVYSAVTKTFNPSSRTKTVHAVIDALFIDMVKRGLLPTTAP